MNKLFDEKPIGERKKAPIGFSDSTNPLFSPDAGAQKPLEKFVVFFLNEHVYAVSSRIVSEVSLPLPVAVLPNAPGWLSGIANLRGEVVSVLNLGKILGETEQTSSPKRKFLILQAKNLETPVAVPVDNLCEVAALDESDFVLTEDNNSPFVYGISAYKSNTMHLIDSERMLSLLTIE
jgi:purine-binding chemotaxis protein CheW